MKESTKKIVTLVSLALGVIVGVFAILFATNQEKFGGLFDIAFWIVVCFIVASILIWLCFGILAVIKKPKKALIFLGIAVVIIIGAFLISGGDSMPADFLAKYDTSASTARLIGAACYTTYVVVLAALVLLIWSEISKAFKK